MLSSLWGAAPLAKHEKSIATKTPKTPHQSLPSQQFQVLFDSLFKVLFIFRSRYLFAIGLPPVFSLGWDVPPAWGCIPKQPDSKTEAREESETRAAHGSVTLSEAPFQGTWRRAGRRAHVQTLQFDGCTGQQQIYTLGSSRFARRY